MNQSPKPSYLGFDATHYAWKKEINYQQNPELYRVGKGEQGVLICEPYKSEIGQYWRFKTPEVAQMSSQKIYSLFLSYLKRNDFVGADMARKYLQMGFTRSRRYANYKGGKKYHPMTHSLYTKGTGDPSKVASANIFYEKWQLAESNKKYQRMKNHWKKKYG